MHLPARADPTAATDHASKGKPSPRENWRNWGGMLRRNRLQGITAWLLEAGGPLALVAAQLLYMGSPFLGTGASRLARLLESDAAAEDSARELELGS